MVIHLNSSKHFDMYQGLPTQSQIQGDSLVQKPLCFSPISPVNIPSWGSWSFQSESMVSCVKGWSQLPLQLIKTKCQVRLVSSTKFVLASTENQHLFYSLRCYASSFPVPMPDSLSLCPSMLRSESLLSSQSSSNLTQLNWTFTFAWRKWKFLCVKQLEERGPSSAFPG